MPSRGPPAYDDKPKRYGDGVGPVYRGVDGPLPVADGGPAWQAPAMRHGVNGPVGPPRPAEFHGPVAHKQMDGVTPPLMAHRGLAIFDSNFHH